MISRSTVDRAGRGTGGGSGDTGENDESLQWLIRLDHLRSELRGAESALPSCWWFVVQFPIDAELHNSGTFYTSETQWDPVRHMCVWHQQPGCPTRPQNAQTCSEPPVPTDAAVQCTVQNIKLISLTFTILTSYLSFITHPAWN